MGWKTAIRQTLKPTIVEFSRPKIITEKLDLNKVVTVDFETFFDVEYTLRKLSTSEYVRHEMFKTQMVGIKIGKRKTQVYSGAQAKRALQAIDWKTYSLLCHNTAFDGFIMNHHYGIVPHRYYDTLSMARGLHSNEIGASLDDVAGYYGKGSKIEGVLDLTKGVYDWDKPLFDRMAVYCAQDVDLTFEIFQEMHKKYPVDELDLINLTIRMFCDPVLKVDIDRVAAEHEREVTKREQLFYAAVNPDDYDIGGKHHDLVFFKKSLLKTGAERQLQGGDRRMQIVKRLLGNNEFFAGLLRAEGIDPPIKVSKAWINGSEEEREKKEQFAYAFAKDDLDFVGLPDNIDLWRGPLDPNKKKDLPKIVAKQDRLRDLIDARLAVKSTTNITRAARFLEAGKDGMSLPVGYAYYRAHCVPGTAGVLTRNGWVRIDEWEGDDIAQWSPNGKIEFLPAMTNEFEVVDESMIRAHAVHHRAVYTAGHNIPALTSTGKFAPRQAGDMLTSRFDLPVSGLADGNAAVSVLDAQLAAMVQADGNIRTDVSRGRCVRFGFRKERKTKRCIALLNEADIAFTKQTDSEGSARVRVGANEMHKLMALISEDKKFSPLLLDAPLIVKTAFLNELSYWDGDVDHNGKGYTYSSTDRECAYFVQTIAHLAGRAASVAVRAKADGWSASYRVYVRDNWYIRQQPKSCTTYKFTGKVYCPTTQTGYFLMMQEGRIVVTGNTGRWGGNNKMNMQNLTRGGELRLSILAPYGHQVAVQDSGQIEARVNGWLWGQHDLMDAFRKADTWDKKKGVARGDDRDAYCRFGDQVYGREITTEDKMERFVGKVCVLGLGFQMGAPKFQMTLAKGALGGPPVYFELNECHRIVNAYRNMNYKIRQGWTKCAQIIEDMAIGKSGTYKCLSWEKETLWLPNGMSLKYPQLRKQVNKEKGWDEWTYQSGDTRSKIYGGLLCENIVQALARIIVATQMLKINKKYRVVMTTHDEVVALPKTRDADKCIAYMAKCMSTAPAWCSDIPLNCEGGYADNYSK